VLLKTLVCLAPVTPFIVEHIYQNLARALPDGHEMKADSIHFLMIPEANQAVMEEKTLEAFRRMQSVVELGRTCRERRKVGLKMPLKSMTIINQNEDFNEDVKMLQKYIEEELNVMEVVYKADAEKSLAGTLNFKALGKRLGKDMKAVMEVVKNLSQQELVSFQSSGKITLCGHDLEGDDLQLSSRLKDLGDPNLDVNGDNETQVIMDFTEDKELELMQLCRHIVNKVQMMRKDAKLRPDDLVDMWAEALPTEQSSGAVQKALAVKKDYINRLLKRELWDASYLQGHEVIVRRREFTLDDKLVVTITARSPVFNAEAMKELTKGDAAAEEACRQYLQVSDLQSICNRGSVKVNFGNSSYELKHKEHFWLGPAEGIWPKK